MAQQCAADPTYVMGRISTETRRLIVQARIFDGLIRRFPADAGIGAGMTRLDSGFGSGDVTRATAYLAGPTGRVIGVDVTPAIVETSQARARAGQRDTVVVVAGDYRTAMLANDGEPAVDQFVLIYTSDTSATMEAVVARVNQGSVVAFTEAGFGTILDSMQAGPGGVYRSAWQWGIRTFASAGKPAAMVAPLYCAFLVAGRLAPALAVQAPSCADECDDVAWEAASLRSFLPLLDECGIATAGVLDVENLAARARAEVTATGYPLMLLPVVTAWTRRRPGNPAA